MQKIAKDEGFTVFIPFSETYLLDQWGVDTVQVIINDGREISNSQRRKIFALISDITDWVKAPGNNKRTRAEKETLHEMGLLYMIECLPYTNYSDRDAIRKQLTMHYCQLVDIAPFSLSNIDVATATDFIDWLVEMCVVHGIPCLDTLLNRCEDAGRYVYACVAHRRCAICGKKADIHEVETVGMGNNRRTIHHLGQLVEPLCREHHAEVGNIGQAEFDAKYHLVGIRLDENLCDILKWKK
ncbi:hypothetical protein LJC61_02635 [Ruminococcaceae bacterium OttesenSCG-928-A16]|nr:hypothetical protein [Ruminococcaceae bacterium OttesenSCG-928-A16]